MKFYASDRQARAIVMRLVTVVVLELLAPEYSGGLDLYLQIQNQSGALRDDACVKYGDSTCVHDPYIAPVRYI